MTQMSMGANIPLSATTVRASLRWTGGPGVPDVDVSALLLDESGEVASDADFVFYNQPTHYSNSVRIAGKTPPPQASDSIDVDLSLAPAATERIVLAASADGGPFGQVPDLQMVLSDLSTGQPLAYFPIQARTETAMVSAELYRRSGAWKFRAVGQGYASGLAGLAADFGIDTGHADSSGSAAPENRADVAPPPAAYPDPVPPPAAPPPAAPPPAAPPAAPVVEAPPAPPAAPPPAAYPDPSPQPAAPPAQAAPPAYPEPAAPAAPPPAPAGYPPAPPGFAPPAPAGYAPSGPPIDPVPAPPQAYPAPEGYAPPAPYPAPEGYPAPTLDPPGGAPDGFSAPTLVEPPAAPPAAPPAPPAPEMAAPTAPPPMAAPAPDLPPAPSAPQPPASAPPGGGVNLQKNQKVELRSSGPAPLARLIFSLGWQPPDNRHEIDMDASVIAFDGSGEKLAIVWYMHLNEFAGALQHTGDNRTGGTGDVEQILVDLVRMPANVNSLIFTINCFRGGTFTDIAAAFCSVHNVDDNQELVRFDLTDTQPSTALLMAELRRAGAGMWQMRAIGEFHDFRTVKKLLPAAARQATMG